MFTFQRRKAAICSLITLFFSSFVFAQSIAITQIVGHPALDKVHQGIVDELNKNGYRDILFENAQGSMVVAAQIANQFVSKHPDVIVAIATPSAQAAANAIKKSNIPLVFASISDPVQAKLVTDLQHPAANITGTRNVSPIDKQIALVKKIMPNIKTLGIVLNYGEINSVDLLKQVTEVAKSMDINVKTSAANSSAEVQTATTNLIGKVDAILLLQDNTVASALPALMKVVNANNIPVFTTYLDAIKAGALAGLAFDEYEIGRQTGRIVVAILKGKKAGDLPVQDPEHIQLVLNPQVAKQLNIKLPVFPENVSSHLSGMTY